MTIALHRIWNPNWGWLEAPCVGQRGTVVSLQGEHVELSLESKVRYRCALSCLEPA
ncbi:hypothetical protein J2788_004980 [Variovorax paradoxus]|nr:hypothetical protein [Variovorax paradoxus]